MSNNAAEKYTFWRLLCKEQNDGKKLNIVVPDLQRDYAEGRTDPETSQIRGKLIKEICESIIETKSKNLNFIYGTLQENKFVPIDGQQRLTTLFLIYWYIFSRSQNSDNRSNGYDILNRFSYESRTTTGEFCEMLCKTKHTNNNDCKSLEWVKTKDENRLSNWIKNKNWFSGNIASDPSVKSMLVVLDNIDKEFGIIEKSKELNFDEIAQYMCSEKCEIEFLWFDVGNFNSEDLYIKMNSRGKYLTEFESFKAKLQPSEDNKTILNSCFDSLEDAVNFIGRINNEYTNLFYKVCRKELFDSAMMNFFITTIKCEQFAYIGSIDQLRTRSKEYRDIFNSSDVGSVFYENYINHPDKQWKAKNTEKNNNIYDNVSNENLTECLIHSIKKIDYILSNVSNLEQFDNNNIINRKLEDYCFSSLLASNKTPSAKNQIRQYAIFEYLYVMKPSDKISIGKYEMWKRFVANILDNASDSKGDGFSDTADACETIYFFYYLIDSICKNQNMNFDKTLLAACNLYSKNRSNSNGELSFPPSINKQMKEELIKLQLICSSDDWKNTIIEAEKYFSDGQILFLFNYLNADDQTGSDIAGFKECFELSKKIFTENKEVNIDNIEWQKLQRAALCCEDTTQDKMANLIHQTNWRFHTEGISNYKKMLSCDDLKLIFTSCQQSQNLNESLDNIQSRDFTDEESWKKYFTGDLFERMIAYNRTAVNNSFSFTIAFRDNSILLLSGERRTSSPSMEIETFNLYSSLPNSIEKELVFATGDRICDEEGNPLRYVKVNDKKIGFSNISHKFVNVSNADEMYETIEEAVSALMPLKPQKGDSDVKEKE